MKRSLCQLLLCLAAAGALSSCREAPPVFHGADNPTRLSEWKLFSLAGNALVPSSQTLRFAPRNTLFSDYAHKFRTLWVPPGAQIAVRDANLDYPVGTVLTKTFYYPVNGSGDFLQQEDRGISTSISLASHRLLETRLLVRRQAGWEALPYVWNESQSEAFLRVAGTGIAARLANGEQDQSFQYFVPNQNQCSGCHVRRHPDGGIEPLGAVVHQLNHAVAGEQRSVLEMMVELGWLGAVPAADPIPDWQDESLADEPRALAYLDINCGHCHNPQGPADTSALLLDGFARTPREMGLCKPPVAAGGGAGDRLYGIVPGRPDESILLYRMASTEPDEMMPELGRALVHREGLALIERWIAAMPGTCG